MAVNIPIVKLNGQINGHINNKRQDKIVLLNGHHINTNKSTIPTTTLISTSTTPILTEIATVTTAAATSTTNEQETGNEQQQQQQQETVDVIDIADSDDEDEQEGEQEEEQDEDDTSTDEPPKKIIKLTDLNFQSLLKSEINQTVSFKTDKQQQQQKQLQQNNRIIVIKSEELNSIVNNNKSLSVIQPLTSTNDKNSDDKNPNDKNYARSNIHALLNQFLAHPLQKVNEEINNLKFHRERLNKRVNYIQRKTFDSQIEIELIKKRVKNNKKFFSEKSTMTNIQVVDD